MMPRKRKPFVFMNIAMLTLISCLDLARCVCQQVQIFFDKIEVIMPVVETQNRHLIAPFHHRLMSLSCEKVNIL